MNIRCERSEDIDAIFAIHLSSIDSEAEAMIVDDLRSSDGPSCSAVAESAGVAIYTLDPLGGTEGKETYQELLRYNAEVLLEALAE